MKKLEAEVIENIDWNTGEITYELWLQDYGNLGSQLIDVAWTFKTKAYLKKLAEKMNNCFDQGGY